MCASVVPFRRRGARLCALTARLEVGLDDFLAGFGWVDGVYRLIGKFRRWRACCFARCRSDSAGGCVLLF